MLDAFLYGTILALGLIMPLGVQNVFIFNQGASQKYFLHALPSVITASLCDAILIMLAVFGISIIVLNIAWLKSTIFIAGFFFLMYMGWNTWKSQSSNISENKNKLSTKRQIGFSLSVSLLNPHAILDTIGVIGTSSLHFMGVAKFAFTSACILVSCFWFLSLSVAGHFIHKIDKNGSWLCLLNKISALVIWGIALYFGYQIISKFI